MKPPFEGSNPSTPASNSRYRSDRAASYKKPIFSSNPKCPQLLTSHMSFDFSKIPSIKSFQNPDPDWDNPIKFFYKLNHPTIKDLYPVQHGILKEWHQSLLSGNNDKIISLDTGEGKTLIGLLMAESIRRHSGGKVIYVCPNNYLVAQCREKAKEYGINVSSYAAGAWIKENEFLENKVICLTNYDAVFNPRSIFRDVEVKGIIFDDAHLSVELLDKQFTLSINDDGTRQKVIDLFKNSPTSGSKIELIEQEDPNTILMVPLPEWNARILSVKNILLESEDIVNSLPWINLREHLNRTLCFISAKRVEISLLYPNIQDHYALSSNVKRVFLSATVPNIDDIIRVFGINPQKILFDNFDYRPERLFIFAEKTKLSDPDQNLRDIIPAIQNKALILVPRRDDFANYRGLPHVEFVETPDEAEAKIKQFKDAAKQTLVLANRYDGIDMQGDACRLLFVDGFPFIGSLKIRHFAQYFSEYKGDFFRSFLSSKIVQAFGRTVRGYDDYSVVFVLGKRLNKWLINKDNDKFFKQDLLEDLEIGKTLSATISDTKQVEELCQAMLSRSQQWKDYIEAERSKITDAERFSEAEITERLQIAKEERKIMNLFYSGYYDRTLTLIQKDETLFEKFSEPMLGLYLSIASVCAIELNNISLAIELSKRSAGIHPAFGRLDPDTKAALTKQAQMIYANKKQVPKFDWSINNTHFEQDLKELGEFLGFTSRRPEQEGDGTLDSCWEDAEIKHVVGFEAKSNKTNSCLSKKEIDQLHGHVAWLQDKYKNHNKKLYAIGEINSYNSLASPTEDLLYVDFAALENITKKLRELYDLKKIMPNLIEVELDRLGLRIKNIFPKNKILDLKKER